MVEQMSLLIPRIQKREKWLRPTTSFKGALLHDSVPFLAHLTSFLHLFDYYFRFILLLENFMSCNLHEMSSIRSGLLSL